MSTPIFRQFHHGTPDYAGSLTLRERILRIPLGKRLSEDDLRGEAGQLHFGLFDSAELAACVVIQPFHDEGRAKLRQMAVAEVWQGRGLGKRLVQTVEEALRRRGFQRVELSARVPAKEFYRKLGYRESDGSYLEQGIEHVHMWKNLTPRDHGPPGTADSGEVA